MKKLIYIVASLFVIGSMQAQDKKSAMPKPGPAPSINVKKPQSFTLENGLKVMVVENHKLPRVSFNLTLDNPPYAEGAKKGVSDLTSALIGNATQTISKEKFQEEIDFLGADFNFSNSGASANGLSKYAGRLLELLADGALNPLFTQEELDAEKSKLIEGLKSNEKSVPAIAARAENILVYGKDHYNGEFNTEESIKNVTLNDVINNYNTYFVPANAYLVIVGDVSFNEVKAKVENLFSGENWKSAAPPVLTYNNPKDVQYSQINFIDVPNAVQSEIALINTSSLKMTDKDYFAAVLANQILGGGGEGRLFMNLREKHGWTYGAYSSLYSGKYVGKFRSSASVRNAVTDSAVVEFFNELKRIRTELVSEDELKNAKAKFIGNFVMQIEKPATIAGFALKTKTLGLPENFYENYVKNINAVTTEDIKNAANKYFLAENTRVVIVGKAADVVTGLEEMSKREKLPIFYFDKFGNKTEKPVIKKDIPAGVTVKSILTNYIQNIGGEAKLKEVKSLYTYSKASIQGQTLELTTKTMVKKNAVSMQMMGMEVMKQVVTEKAGYKVQQGQKSNVEGDDLKRMQENAMPFAELGMLTNTNITLAGIESINGTDCYVLKNNKSKYFYDVKTGLKTAIENEITNNGQTMTNTIYFGDYVEFKGIKFPYKTTINAGMPLEFTTQEVKINEGVTEKDFE